MTDTTLDHKITCARRKDFYEGTWWDENGEGAWFPTDRWEAWEAVAGYAYMLQDGDLTLGDISVYLVGEVSLMPDPDDSYEDRHIKVDEPTDDSVEAWEVRSK